MVIISISAIIIGRTERDRDTVDLRYKGLSTVAIVANFYAKINARTNKKCVEESQEIYMDVVTHKINA